MRVVNLLDRGLTAYQDADIRQRSIHAGVADGTEPDTFLVFESNATYTAGRHTRPGDITDPDLPIVDTDRAGSITWHGPGQLIVYPIVKLTEPVDLHAYIRAVEGSVLDTLRDHCGLDVVRIDGRAGVWLRNSDRKISAIGLKISRAATLHGISLNVNTDFTSAFSGIVPCGINDAGVTSLAQEGISITLDELVEPLTAALRHRLAPLLARGAGADTSTEKLTASSIR